MRQITSYDLACGGVQREEINGHWVELYRESNCYHIRMGEIGHKWSEWETEDILDGESLKNARWHYAEFKKEIKNLREYLYVIDLDERGEFRAHVEDKNTDKIVFSFSSDEDGLSIVEDGFMKHTEDTDGLEVYLKQLGIIPEQSSIVN